MYLSNLLPALYAGFLMMEGFSLQWNRSNRSALQDFSFYSIQFAHLFGQLEYFEKCMLTSVLRIVEGHHPYRNRRWFAFLKISN